MSKGPSWFNVTVFVLTRRPLQASVLAAVTIASWLLLSDYVFAREGWIWEEWENVTAFLLPSALTLSFLVLVTRSRIMRKDQAQPPTTVLGERILCRSNRGAGCSASGQQRNLE